jgi:hypothetical protein
MFRRVEMIDTLDKVVKSKYFKYPGADKALKIISDNWFDLDMPQEDIVSIIKNQVPEFYAATNMDYKLISYLGRKVLGLESRRFYPVNRKDPVKLLRPQPVSYPSVKPEPVVSEEKKEADQPVQEPVAEKRPVKDVISESEQISGLLGSPVKKFFIEALFELDYVYESSREEILKVMNKALEIERKMALMVNVINSQEKGEG